MALATPIAEATPFARHSQVNPWPRPVLRLVGTSEAGVPLGVLPPGGDPVDLGVHSGIDVSVRRRLRTSRRVRRRRVGTLILVGTLIGLLALPVSALGGRAIVAGQPGRVAAPALAGATYVVQPGDTLWSIATRFDGGGDPRPLVRALASRLGSDTVSPGERIHLP